MAVIINSYTIQDNDGVKASAPFYRGIADPGEMDLEAISAEWTAFGTKLDAVTGGQIIGGHILVPLMPDGGWKASPLTGQSVSDTLNMNFSVAENQYLWGLIVPALRDTLVVDGRPVIATGAIATLITALTTGITGELSTNNVGFDLVALVNAFQGVRKHRRQLKANSNVPA